MCLSIELYLQVVVDRKDRIFTWGFGGYGRLGHDENKDELVPRLLKFFDGPNRGAAMIAAGSTFSLAVNKLGQHTTSFSELWHISLSLTKLVLVSLTKLVLVSQSLS